MFIKNLLRKRYGRLLFVALCLLGVVFTMACTLGPLTVGGCNDGPYNWDKDRPGGTNGGECQDANGNPAVADCCCFVASASGLTHEQIGTLRIVRDWMLNHIPGFDKVNYAYHTVVGPNTANFLRSHVWAKNLSHNILVPVSAFFHLFVR